MEVGYTIPELESSQKLNRPVDQQKITGVNLKWQMDIDEQVYVGDPSLNFEGLVNQTGVPVSNSTADWADPATPVDDILAEVNEILTDAWSNTGFARTPTKMLLPPLLFSALVSRKVSDAGNVSVIRYLQDNSIAMANNGRMLDIRPVKWLTDAGVGGVPRIVVYNDDEEYVRIPLVPLQRTPLENRSIYQLFTYYGRIGVVEVVYPEMMHYVDITS
jgi:hypothetical protein